MEKSSVATTTGTTPIRQKLSCIRIVGMSRSGNHAVINWILSQLSGSWHFLNCVEPKTNPFRSARPLDDGSTTLSTFKVAQNEQDIRTRADHLVFSQEDTFLEPALGKTATERQGVGDEGADVLVLRDPYNLMASRKKAGWCRITRHAEKRIWKQHAKRVLSARPFGKRKLVPVLFNDWTSIKDYRRQIALELQLAFTDRGLDGIARCGGGSSFQGYDDAPDGLLNRWRAFAKDRDYWSMIDAEMADLAKEIFGIADPRSELL